MTKIPLHIIAVTHNNFYMTLLILYFQIKYSIDNYICQCYVLKMHLYLRMHNVGMV